MVTNEDPPGQAAARRTSKRPKPAEKPKKLRGVSKKSDTSPKPVASRRGAAAPSHDKPQRRPAAKTPAAPRRRSGLAPEAIAEIFRRFHGIEPEPKGELEYVNPYTLLVAVVLSAQATDAGVNKATRALFKLADTPQKMVRLGEDRVREAVRTIGLFRTKAKNVIALSQQLIERHGGDVPVDREALEKLPGVGRKTANVVLNVAFGMPTMAVDTHVFRVAHRIGLSAGKTPAAVEADLVRLIPHDYAVPAHHWLILHGRYLCKARKPECYRCPIRDLCRFPDKSPAASD